jgi:hypothetical protein
MRGATFLMIGLSASGCVERALSAPDRGADLASVDLASVDLAMGPPACVVGAPPVLLSSDVDALTYQLAVDRRGVYYPGADQTVRAISRYGGASRVIAPRYAQYLALGGATLYTTQTRICDDAPCQEIVAVDPDVSTVVTVLALAPAATAHHFVADEHGVYFSLWQSDQFALQTVVSGSAVTLRTTPDIAFGMALDATTLYAAPQGDALVAIDRATGEARVLVEANANPNLVAAAANEVYFSDAGGAVKKLPKVGGAVVQLSGGPWAWALAPHGDSLYWNGLAGPDSDRMVVNRVGRAGGPVTTLAELPSYSNSPIAVDDDCVYFVGAPPEPLPIPPGGLNPPFALYKVAR